MVTACYPGCHILLQHAHDTRTNYPQQHLLTWQASELSEQLEMASKAVLCVVGASSILMGILGENPQKDKITLQKNPLLPNHWAATVPSSRLTTAFSAGSNVTASATGYLVANMFFGSESCAVPQTGVYSTATGVCFAGVDSSNESAGSIVYTFGGVGANGYIEMYTSVFESENCSGEYKTSAFAVPTSCFADEENMNSYIYTYTTNPQPWTSYGPGLMFTYYSSVEACGDISGLYGWYGVNTCLPATTGDGTAISTAFTMCSGGLYTQTIFSDSKCSEFAQAVTSKLMDCQESNDGGDSDVSPSKQFESFFCTV